MYLHPFHKKHNDHDFSVIYDTINEYYPINQPKRLTSHKFGTTRGYKKLERLMAEEFFNEGVYDKKWGKLVAALRQVLNKPVLAYPEMTGPALFGQVILSKINEVNFIREKTLNFHISVIGPFFSIHGLDHSTALLQVDTNVGPNELGFYTAKHALTISPVFEYEESFNALETAIRQQLPGYLLVPYEIGMSTIKHISRSDEISTLAAIDTVYEGLFGSVAVHDTQTRGDNFYGEKDWFKPLTTKEKKLLDVVVGHIKESTNEITLHKVWKLTESKKLDVFTILIGFDFFDVLDLTEKSKLIFSGGPRGGANEVSYKIVKGMIKLSSGYAFRIVEVTGESLVLRLLSDMRDGKTAVEGEVMEYRFVQMKKVGGRIS